MCKGTYTGLYTNVSSVQSINHANLEAGLLSSIYTINNCNQHGITSAHVYEVNLLSGLAPTGCLLQTIWQVPACSGSPPCTSFDSTLRWSYFAGVAAHQSLFGRRRRCCYHSCTKVTCCHFSVSGCDFKYTCCCPPLSPSYTDPV